MPDYQFHTYAPDALTYDDPSFSFTLAADYDFRTDRNLIEYSDDDTQLDGDQNDDGVGDDANQVGSAYDDTGAEIANGTVYVQHYAIIQDSNGGNIYLDRIEIDGVHVGYISSAPLIPGESYTVVAAANVGDTAGSNGSDNTMSHSYYETNTTPCFASDTLIETKHGSVPAEQIKAGDLLRGLDGAWHRVLWSHAVRQNLCGAPDGRRPILISKGALGRGRPARDLVVSSQHRILIGHPSQGAGLARRPMLVPAKSLQHLRGVRKMLGKASITWVHFACQSHQVIEAHGCLSETILLGATCLGQLPAYERLRLLALFGHNPKGEAALNGPAAYPCLGASAATRELRRCCPTGQAGNGWWRSGLTGEKGLRACG
ncbi:Hint domain-containing protein [uncultured Litoreibacter sp.]|uniref:Hint domain-containing protein n=1 Tax=uncultured Litoreibacter sp. TaxID=1392394 RepID=UPI0026259724|nr:Hint domain-containing protein [uncultured Litoreibacter sp.]